MNNKNKFLVIYFFSLILLASTISNAQDVKLKIPKTSIDNMMNAFTKAKYFSYGATDLGGFVQYYSLKPQSASVNIQSGNIFSIYFTLDWVANVNLTIFNFDIGEQGKNVTLTGTIQLRTLENGYKIVLVPQNISSSSGGTLSSIIYFAGSGILAKLPEMSININQPLLPGIIEQYFTSATPTLTTTTNEVVLSLTLKAGPRYNTAFNDVNQTMNIGFVQDEEGTNNYVSYPSPKTFEWNTGTTQKLQTPVALLDASNGKNKYRQWLNSLGSSQNEIAPRRIQLTVGTQDETYKAKFDLAKRVQLSNILEGQFSGGTVSYQYESGATTTVITLDDYDFRNMTYPHPINTSVPNGTLGYNWVFQNWSDGNTSPNRNIILNNDVNLIANFKGTQLSSQDNAYNNTSQRKFIRLHNNEMIHLYSSMNKTWLETSTNNGVTWLLRNGGKPLTQQESKLPSVCQIEQSRIIIALQERKINGGYYIKVLIYDLASDLIVAEGIAAEPANKLYTEDANPVVACPREGIQNFLVVWEEADYGGYQPGGLYYRYGKLISGPVVNWISTSNLITGTDLNSHVPALVTDFSDNIYPIYYRLAYEQYSSGNVAAIHYRNLSANVNSVTVPSTTNISVNAGFSKNTKPSLIAASNGARIAWIGYRVIDEELSEQRVIFVDPSNLSHYWNFGMNVQSTSINQSDACYSIAWGRSNSLPIQFADSYTLSNIFTISDLSGKDVQLSNGTTRTTMRAMAFNSNSQPYYFNNKQLYSTNKVNFVNMGNGREGVVTKNNAQFYFAIGDINVNNQPVKFIEFDDTVSFYNSKRLNEFLVSEPFELNNNSDFTYHIQYGTTDSLAASKVLDNKAFINYKVELIDDKHGNTIGVFDDIKFSKSNVNQHDIINYQVDTKGIGNKTVRLRLITENNFDSRFALTDRYAEENALLPKASFKQINFQGSLEIKDYALEQNYPNPFNPSTTISYQVKEDGLVTLKLYDILGAELKTLVNEEKTKGRYTRNFNGSDLASGVYIYQLKVNDYVSSKKLMLVK